MSKKAGVPFIAIMLVVAVVMALLLIVIGGKTGTFFGGAVPNSCESKDGYCVLSHSECTSGEERAMEDMGCDPKYWFG